MNKIPLIIIAGPTAVGKTELSIALAKKMGGEVISADSMQVYKGMDIGSAKVSMQQRIEITHHLVDCLTPNDSFDVAKFQQMAKDAISLITGRGHIPIVVGGTGFYIQALLYDIDFEETAPSEAYRNSLSAIVCEKGNEYLHGLLRQVDEQAALAIHPNNVKRVIRALEYYHQYGKKISEHNEIQRKKKSPYNYAYFVLNDDRAILYERIDQRVNKMMEDGLLDEVRRLKDSGYTKDMVSMQGLGYKELLSYFDGDISLDYAIEIIKRDTRHFAKRQITWFKREKDVIWLERNDFQSDTQLLSEEVIRVCRERKVFL